MNSPEAPNKRIGKQREVNVLSSYSGERSPCLLARFEKIAHSFYPFLRRGRIESTNRKIPFSVNEALYEEIYPSRMGISEKSYSTVESAIFDAVVS